MIKSNNTPVWIPALFVSISILTLVSCNPKNNQVKDDVSKESPPFLSFTEDVSFLEKYTEIIQLADVNGGIIAVSPALQGRVMTSSSSAAGRSYGWINRSLFESGDTLNHINAFGGEERFWLGPEGGQFSIFFEKDAPFTLDYWQTPSLIDLDPYHVVSKSKESALFSKEATLTNYSGFTFYLGIERKISILSKDEIANKLGLSSLENIKVVGYETTNTLTNKGDLDWDKKTGLLSIWLLGMFTPSDKTTIVIPYRTGNDTSLGKIVNDTYFGKVPSERMIIDTNTIFFKGDGKYRSKIGLLPGRATNIAGSYDSGNKTLTIIKYNKPEGVTDYVNSLWEIQAEPYAGDAVNAYNDGPPSPGVKPLGPFYELETSSPALSLQAGESRTHIRVTCHLEGDEEYLDPIAKQLLGTSLQKIKNAFK